MKAKSHSERKQPEGITPIQPPPHKDIGFNTSIVEKAIAAGPAGLRQAQRKPCVRQALPGRSRRMNGS